MLYHIERQTPLQGHSAAGRWALLRRGLEICPRVEKLE